MVFLNDRSQGCPHLLDLLGIRLRPSPLEPDGAQQIPRDAQEVSDEVDCGPRDGIGGVEKAAEDAADRGSDAPGEVADKAAGAIAVTVALRGGEGGAGGEEGDEGGELHGGKMAELVELRECVFEMSVLVD